MIELIKTRRCPTCGAQPVEYKLRQSYDGQVLVHMNGQRWESVKFVCGLVVEWIPNFSREQVSEFSRCGEDPAVKTALRAKDDLIDRMVKMIRTAEGVDVQTQDNLIDSFSWKRSRT